MKHVIERCPSCGVEHEAPGDGTCEACGTMLRHWCRAHGRESGWLDGPACRRCAEEAARPRPVPRPPSPPPAPRGEPARPRGRPVAAAPRARPAPPAPAAPPLPRPYATPPADAPASPLARMAGRLLAAFILTFLGWLTGLVSGAVYAFNHGLGIEPTAGAWGWVGAGAGLVTGLAGAGAYTLYSNRRGK